MKKVRETLSVRGEVGAKKEKAKLDKMSRKKNLA